IDCWVHGEDVERIFTVELLGTDTVADLKKAIKYKNVEAFESVDARTLDLYSLRLLDIEDELKQWNPSGKRILNGRTELSTLFPNGEWLIIVSTPSSRAFITLNCWVRGHTFHDVFSVKISSTETVGAIQKVIKSEYPLSFRDVDADTLNLHKVTLPYGEDDILEDVLGACTIASLGEPLRSLTKLSAVFTPPPPDDQLHLII
ncbi:hypothetical protein EDC04DRAFT_2525525, partial [Pisolithus marmoratus]